MIIKRNKRLFSNAAALSVLQIFNYVAPLLILPYLTRVFTVEEFGTVMVAMAIVQFSFVITDFGFSLSAVYSISKNRENRVYINNLVSRIFSAKIILLFIALLCVLGVSYVPAFNNYQIIFLSGIIAVVAQAYQPLWLFHGLEKMKYFTVYMACTKVLYVLLVFVLINESGDGWLVLMSWSLANLIGMIVSLIMIKKMKYEVGFSSLDLALSELKKGVEYFWSRLAVSFYTSASSIIVGAYGLNQAAMYTSAEQVYKAGQAVTSPINQAMYPYMAKEKNWGLFFKLVIVVLLVLLAGVSFVGYFASFFIGVIFGSQYLDAVPVLWVMLATLLINYVAVSFGYPACAAIDRNDIANKSVNIGFVLFAIILSILVVFEAVTALSVSISVLVVELFVMTYRLVFFFRGYNAGRI